MKTLNYGNLAPGTAPTAGVSFTYDPDFPRPNTMTDATGLTNFDYYPAPRTDALPGAVQLGALLPKTINGPITGNTDLITYTYDELGRLKTNNIGATGVENLTNRIYDSLGRIETITNSLGNFGFEYVERSRRIHQISFPNSQQATFDYHLTPDNAGGNGDKRLKSILNTRLVTGSTETLSKFDYTYLKDGNIASWQRQLGPNAATANMLTLGYDSVDQLTSATLAQVASPYTVSQRYSYQYDAAGNRISQQSGNKVNRTDSNSANQIMEFTGGGKFLVTGYTDEPAKVKVNGEKATTTPTSSDPASKNLFQAWVNLEPGLRTITIEAEDYVTPPNKNPPFTTPSTPPKQWTVNVTGDSNRSFTYDGNGNVLSDGIRNYIWDAENRLVKITKGVATYEFYYDGLSRRVRITERNAANAVISDKRYLWAGGAQPAEERDTLGTTVLKQYHDQGEFFPTGAHPLNKLFYSRDHLGSIREVIDGSSGIRARYDYDPFGNRVNAPIGVDGSGDPVYGDISCDFGFAGYYYHVGADLHLTRYRAYDQNTGRWLSADPLGEAGGLNLYAYVLGNPLNLVDPLGLCSKGSKNGSVQIAYSWGATAGMWHFFGVGGHGDTGIGISIDFDDLLNTRPFLTSTVAVMPVGVGAGVTTGPSFSVGVTPKQLSPGFSAAAGLYAEGAVVNEVGGGASGFLPLYDLTGDDGWVDCLGEFSFSAGGGGAGPRAGFALFAAAGAGINGNYATGSVRDILNAGKILRDSLFSWFEN